VLFAGRVRRGEEVTAVDSKLELLGQLKGTGCVVGSQM